MKFSKFTKITSIFVVGAVAAKSLLSGKKGGSGKIAAARKAVEEANARARDAVRLGKAADVVALYTDDATVLPEHLDMIKGRDKIEAFWRMAVDIGMKDIVFTTVDVDVHADTIREIGTYVVKFWPEGKAAREDSGKYVVIWKRQPDGSLKIETDIWNTSLPASEP
jgi:ketosteroid isomerase-like protein